MDGNMERSFRSVCIYTQIFHKIKKRIVCSLEGLFEEERRSISTEDHDSHVDAQLLSVLHFSVPPHAINQWKSIALLMLFTLQSFALFRCCGGVW